MKQQNAAAFALDLGLSTSLFPSRAGDCAPLVGNCTTSDQQLKPEVSGQQLDDLTVYTNNLPVPRTTQPMDMILLLVRDCSNSQAVQVATPPSFTTGSSPETHTHLRNRTIWPYVDLLLHDMGDDLADNFLEGDADYWEWRTLPLWGIGQNEAVNGNAAYLHDGRARALLEAILWHGGEASKSAKIVQNLTPKQRKQLIEFLKSL